MKTKTVWTFQIISALVLAFMAMPKLLGAEEPIELFTQLGMEPTGRILTGVLELASAAMLLVPSSAAYGAVLAAGLMSGAVLSHVTKLGFEGSMLTMFILAAVLLAANFSIIYQRRREIPIVKHMFARNESS